MLNGTGTWTTRDLTVMTLRRAPRVRSTSRNRRAVSEGAVKRSGGAGSVEARQFEVASSPSLSSPEHSSVAREQK